MARVKNVTPPEELTDGDGKEPRLAALPPSMGAVMEPVQPPQQVGEIAASQAVEIRARNELIKQLEADAQKANRLVAVANNEKRSFIRQLIIDRGLSARDNHSIDDETGTITLIARYVEKPVLVEESEVASEE